MKRMFLPWSAAFAAALLAPPSLRAADFANPGAPARLAVEYVYESGGSTAAKGDSHKWTVRREAQLEAALLARPPSALPAMHKQEAAQAAALQKDVGTIQRLAANNAGMMADVQKLMEKCGDDEACMEREAMKLSQRMQGTPQMAQALKDRDEAKTLGRHGPMRYQIFEGREQKGSYRIEESSRIVHADPICVNLPRQRCTREEKREGGGAIPAPPGAKGGTLAMVEVDTQGRLWLRLPVPLSTLPYTETVTTDEPEGTHDTPTPKGPQARQLLLRLSPQGSSGAQGEPLIAPFKGGWKSQSGEQLIELPGRAGEGGRLRVKWRFTVG